MTRFVAVIDIGKTNAKVALVDLETASEIAVTKTPNKVVSAGPYPHFDIEALWAFICGGLANLSRDHQVDAISITTHGATAVLVQGDGSLALLPMDYEFTGLDKDRAKYEALRPPFDETGSPSLAVGLNIGAQIFWLSQQYPDEFAKCKWILTYPQYWAYRLSGVMASEATSLGCHTDLWNPWAGDFSSLVVAQGWRSLFPEVRLANANLGPIRSEIASHCGLAQGTPVFCGIHDSNASLLPYLGHGISSFSVVSTGTWIISLCVGGARVELDPKLDTLVNVNANGDPTPTARFMGGREFDLLTAGDGGAPELKDIETVLTKNIMALPDVGSFTFPNGGPHNAGERQCMASYYCALRTAHCLDLIGASGPIFIEGPFSKNEQFLSMLSAITARPVCPSSAGSTGTSLGAALLAAGDHNSVNRALEFKAFAPSDPQEESLLRRYAERWNQLFR